MALALPRAQALPSKPAALPSKKKYIYEATRVHVRAGAHPPASEVCGAIFFAPPPFASCQTRPGAEVDGRRLLKERILGGLQ